MNDGTGAWLREDSDKRKLLREMSRNKEGEKREGKVMGQVKENSSGKESSKWEERPSSRK